MSCYNIMAIHISNRLEKAVDVQSVLTKHGCFIKMRLGLHEANDKCSNEGLVILQVCGEEEEIKAVEKDLNSIKGVKAKTMTISPDD